MTEQNNKLTTGDIKITLLKFALPYLLACFLQTFYGLADLFVVGLYNGSETSTAVSIGSQVMHMLTVMIAGLAMGTCVNLGHSIGAQDSKKAKKTIGNTIIIFSIIAVVITAVLLLTTKNITQIMMTPIEATEETKRYLFICFAGLPFIIAYNVIGSVYRGVGDSKSPMLFVAIACVVNIIVDFIFVGGFDLGASGAALGTVIGQAVSVIVSLLFIKRIGLGFQIGLKDVKFVKTEIVNILSVGFPICLQDGLIQIAFILITVIANSRGLIDSVSVGVVEKLISFMFLVPSAFLSALSAITAQNMGANLPVRARRSLYFGLFITTFWGVICCIYCQIFPESLIIIFRRESEIVASASTYIRAYSFDCIFAAIHFCFSGYFCGCKKSGISFIHNILSVALVRVPGAYFASLYFPETLFPMGIAAPAGSFFSVLICLGFYFIHRKKSKIQEPEQMAKMPLSSDL